MPSLIVPIKGKKGEFLIGRTRDICVLKWDGTDGGEFSLETVCQVEADRDDTRFNDGKVDHKGRLWAGTMQIEVREGQASQSRSLPS